MDNHAIQRFARGEVPYAEGAKYACKWQGYDVWIPLWSEPIALGPPICILVKGEKIRLTEPDEGFAILDFMVKHHPELCKDE